MKVDVQLTLEHTDNLEYLIKILHGIEALDALSNVKIDGSIRV